MTNHTPLKTRAIYEKHRRHEHRNGNPRRIPALGTQRRIRALMTLGWSSTALAQAGGWTSNREIQNLLYARKYVYRQTAQRVAELYERLCMTEGPSAITRLHAERNNWTPPLGWDDIDHDPEPHGVGHQHFSPHDRNYFADIDEVVVQRILGGDWRLPCTRAEKQAVVAAWTGSYGDLERLTGWKTERYITHEEGAA